MNLFNQIVNNVDATIEPSVESMINIDLDEEMDDVIEDACEAAKVPVKEKGSDPKIFEDLPDEEIQALLEAGSEEEDIDDDFDQIDADELLAELPDAMYSFVDPTSDLDKDDEAYIADDFDDDDDF